MIICGICSKEVKPFHIKDKYCRTCSKIAHKRDKARHTLIKRKRRGRLLDKYKIAKGCEICGYKDNVLALQWDHIDPKTKHATIGSMLGFGLEKLFIELRKCRILCANCHCIHTYSARHTWRNQD